MHVLRTARTTKVFQKNSAKFALVLFVFNTVINIICTVIMLFALFHLRGPDRGRGSSQARRELIEILHQVREAFDNLQGFFSHLGGFGPIASRNVNSIHLRSEGDELLPVAVSQLVLLGVSGKMTKNLYFALLFIRHGERMRL